MYKKDLRTKYYIIKDGMLFGRVWSLDSAQKICLTHNAAYCCIYEHLLMIDDEWLYKLYEKYVGPLPPPPMNIESMAKELFTAFEELKVGYIPKPSCRDVLRTMYTERNTWTKEEICLMIPKCKWATIRVGMSQLKPEGIHIKHEGDGFYVRQ